MSINKNKISCHPVNLAFPSDQSENKRKRKERKYLDLARELKKLWNMKMTVIPLGKESKKIGNQGKSRDHADYTIV